MRRTRLPALRAIPVRIDCGADDPFAGAARDLAARLPDAEVDFGDGFHDAGTWRHRVPAQVAFLRRALPG